MKISYIAVFCVAISIGIWAAPDKLEPDSYFVTVESGGTTLIYDSAWVYDLEDCQRIVANLAHYDSEITGDGLPSRGTFGCALSSVEAPQ